MNLSFIKLDINIMNDSKVKFIRKMPDGDKLLVLWIGILCLGMKSGNPGIVEIGDGIPFTAETLAVELDIQLNTVKMGLETFAKFKMIEVWKNQEIFIVNFEKHQTLEKIRKSKEKSRITSKKNRQKMKRLSCVTVTQPSRDGHVHDRDKTDIEEERDSAEREKGIHHNNMLSANDNTTYAHTREGLFCPACQTQINPEDSVCPNCGESLEVEF